ncbi:MAG: hypothetical protein GY938_04985 [Ketobacter sp.]|nr:hypothetical protein [Ketobacter sp.]
MSDWRQAPIVGADDWRNAEIVDDSQSGAGDQRKASGPFSFPAQVGEGIVSFLSSLPASLAAGVGGAMALQDGPEAAGEAFSKIAERRTMSPRTPIGQQTLDTLTFPFEVLEKGVDQRIQQPGLPPGLQTAAKTTLLGLPALLGLTRGAPKSAPKPTPRQMVARRGAQEGYVTPPSQGGTASRGAQLSEGLGGKIKVKQEAISRNQQVTNKIVARELGLPEGELITVDALSGIRATAGQAYEAVRGAGRVFTDIKYRRDLSAAASQFKNAAKDFPKVAKSEVTAIIDSLRKAEFDAGAGVDAIRILRNKADVAFRGGDKGLGGSYKAAANAIEGTIERHLGRGGDAALLNNFRNARQKIAKTYTVQDALQGRITGEINASVLAAKLKKGKPLTGGLRTVAEFANTFPTATRLFHAEPLSFSPLDLAVGGASAGLAGTLMTLGAGPAGLIPLAGTVARPLMRRAALSDFLNMPKPKPTHPLATPTLLGEAQLSGNDLERMRRDQ